MATKTKKIKIPKSVLDLRMSEKKFAKKHGIKLKGKGVSKGERKRAKIRLRNDYSEAAINGLNKAVKILSETSSEGKQSKKVDKIKGGISNILTNSAAMKRVAKLYNKNPDSYQNMIFLPHMIMNTLVYYSSDGISDEDKEVGEALDKDGLITFCEKILKAQTKRYRKFGLSPEMAYQLATVVPTTKILKTNRSWYKKLIDSLYTIAATEDVNLDNVLPAIQKIDKKNTIDKKEFYQEFYSAFIFMKSSNKNHSFNDSQKELHESLIERTLEYLDSQKKRNSKEILKRYIKKRKTAESYKNDTKRIIKFVDYAHSNSSYTNLKAVVQELISDNSSNEQYLS